MTKKKARATKTKTIPRDSFEQQLWDDLVRTSVSRGDEAHTATSLADRVIASRRKQGAA